MTAAENDRAITDPIGLITELVSAVEPGLAADRIQSVVLTVGGRVDLENCPGVCDAASVASGFSASLVVDLSRAEFASTAAEGLFVGTLQRSRVNGSLVCVVCPPESAGRLLRAHAQAVDIPTCADLQEAMAALPGPGARAPQPD